MKRTSLHWVLVSFVAGGAAAALILLLSPPLYLRAADAIAWRLGSQSVAQARLERTLTAIQLQVGDMQSEPGAIWFGDSLLQYFPPSFQSGVVSNFAIGGETAIDLARRLPRYASLARAREIVLLSGRNDLNQRQPPDDTLAAFRQILAHIPATVPVTLIGVPPARDPAERTAQRLALNRALAAQCATRAGCRFINSDALGDANGQLLPQYDAGDGVHLNAEAYRVLAGLIFSTDRKSEPT